ncbi:MAG: DUF1738 domain-containing protein [Eggerthellaceae bacterium]|nr:DUF1738 domain-containing protein [Eggerthellaceae bacterium]
MARKNTANENKKRKLREVFDDNHLMIVDALFEKLGEDLSWNAEWEAKGLYKYLNPVNFEGKSYTGCNELNLGVIAWKNGWADNRWFSINRANELGYKVRKGEHSSIVEHYGLRYMMFDRASGDVLKYSWVKPKEYDEGAHELRCWMEPHHFNRVFNAHQLEGIELRAEPEKLPEKALVPTIDRLIASSRCPIYEQRMAEAPHYSIGFDCINVPLRSQFFNLDAFASVVAHEMTHSTGLELGRKFGKKGTPEYAKEELVAELGSMFLCAALGFDFHHKVEREDNSAAYIASWLKRTGNKDKELDVYKAAQKALKASKLLKERHDNADAVEDAA